MNIFANLVVLNNKIPKNYNDFFLISADNEFVFINFYADWCRFSNMLSPVWDEAADKAMKEFPEKGKVVFGKVDCDKESKYLLWHV